MILPAYFVREALKLSGAIIGGLFVVYLSTRFASYLGEAAEGKLAPEHIARMVLLKMVVSMKDLLPLSLFLGTFGAVTRIQQNSEWTAMRAAGVSHQQLLRPVLLMSGSAAVLVGIITLFAGPRVELNLQELEERSQNEATIAGVKAGRFRGFGGNKRMFYAESISADEQSLLNAFVQTSGKSEDDVLRSELARIETDPKSRDRFAVFERGISYTGVPGRLDYTATEFSRYAVRIEDKEQRDISGYVGFLYTTDLFGRKKPIYGIEFQWRLALPICTFLAPPLAMLIALSNKRGAWHLGLVTAIGAYFAYTNVLGVGRAMLRKGDWPDALGLWPVHLVFLAVVVAMFLWHRRLLRFKRKQPRQELLRA